MEKFARSWFREAEVMFRSVKGLKTLPLVLKRFVFRAELSIREIRPIKLRLFASEVSGAAVVP